MRKISLVIVLLAFAPFIMAPSGGSSSTFDATAIHKFGPQTMVGPLTLTCAACDALVITGGSKVCLNATCTSYLYNAGVNDATLHGGAQGIYLEGDVTNFASGNFQLEFQDATHAVLFQSDFTPTGGVDTAYVFNTSQAFANADYILALKNNGTVKDVFYGNGDLLVGGGLTVSNPADMKGQLYNSGAGNGGSLAIDDPLRSIVTTGFLLESSVTMTGGADTAFTLNSLNTVDNGDFLMLIKNNGTNRMALYGNGGGSVSGNWSGATFLASTGSFESGTAGTNAQVKGQDSTDGSGVGVALDNGVTFTTDGDKLTSFRNNTAEKAYISHVGAMKVGGSVVAVPAQPYACASGHDGEMIYARDTDAGAGSVGHVCYCQCDGQASPTCIWKRVVDETTNCF